MRLWTFLLAAAALVALALPSSGGTTDALDPLATAVAARLDATGDVARADRVLRRRLEAVAARIAQPSETIADDLRVARGVGLLLQRWFRGDAVFAPLFDDAVGALATSADDERSRLAAWTELLGVSTRGRTLAARLRGVDALFAHADRARGPASRLGSLRGACTRIERTRAALKLVGDPPPVDAAMPGFALVDVNVHSPTYRRIVSPRDFVGMASAWYFGHAT
jgi:hypothetical protein